MGVFRICCIVCMMFMTGTKSNKKDPAGTIYYGVMTLMFTMSFYANMFI